MLKTARAMALAVLVLLSSIALGVVSAMTAAFALAATALIVPGTGTHNINPPNAVIGYKENARDRFMTNTPCVGNACTLQGVNYPASFFPLGFPPFPASWCPGLSCKTWNESVGEGVTNLILSSTPYIYSASTEPIVVFGYSQGGAVVSHWMYDLAGLPQATKDRITIVTIGNIENPQGLWSRLSFLPTIPSPLNITFGPVLPTNIGVKSYNYVFEYDAVGDAPLWVLNPLALLNGLAAFQYVHGNYLVPNSNSPDESLPYGYDDATLAAAISNPANIRTYQDGTFILIPQQGTLPIFQPLADILPAPLANPIIDLISPVTKVLINTAYDRAANPGIPQTFQLFPTWVNPVTLTLDLINAGIQGIQAFVNDLGNTLTTLAPAAPTTLSTLSTLSNRVQAPSTETPKPEVQLSTTTTDDSLGTQPQTSQLTLAKPLTLGAPKLNAPRVKPGNVFTPGQTTPPDSKTETTNTPPATGTVTPLPGATTAPGATTTPGVTTPPVGASTTTPPAAGESSAADASHAAAA